MSSENLLLQSQNSLNKITTVQKTYKLWGRCPRPLDSPTSLSESEREAERTISRFAPIYLSFCWIAIVKKRIFHNFR